MKLETIQIDNTVRSGLNSFTDGVIIRKRQATAACCDY